MFNSIFNIGINKKTDQQLIELYLRREYKYNFSPKEKEDYEVDIIVFAFNNSTVIKWQYNLLKKYIKEKFNYWIIDNSTKQSIRKQLVAFSKANDISYLSLPKNPLPQYGGSFSHGLAINWSLRNLSLNKSYVVLLDHDIFLMDYFSIKSEIKKAKFYGVKQERGTKIYLWPGLFIIDNKQVSLKDLNFLPETGLDTGGRNWNFFINYNKKDFLFLFIKYFSLSKLSSHRNKELKSLVSQDSIISKNEKKRMIAEDDLIEVFDNKWIHFFNVSDWKKTGDKTVLINELLNMV